MTGAFGSPVVAAVPGAGWSLEWTAEGGQVWVTEVIAFAVRADGSSSPIVRREDGKVGGPPTDRWKVIAPEEPQEAYERVMWGRS